MGVERSSNARSRQRDILQLSGVFQSSRTARSGRWLVMISYGGAAIFGLVFWIVLARIFL